MTTSSSCCCCLFSTPFFSAEIFVDILKFLSRVQLCKLESTAHSIRQIILTHLSTGPPFALMEMLSICGHRNEAVLSRRGRALPTVFGDRNSPIPIDRMISLLGTIPAYLRIKETYITFGSETEKAAILNTILLQQLALIKHLWIGQKLKYHFRFWFPPTDQLDELVLKSEAFNANSCTFHLWNMPIVGQTALPNLDCNHLVLDGGKPEVYPINEISEWLHRIPSSSSRCTSSPHFGKPRSIFLHIKGYEPSQTSINYINMLMKDLHLTFSSSVRPTVHPFAVYVGVHPHAVQLWADTCAPFTDCNLRTGDIFQFIKGEFNDSQTWKIFCANRNEEKFLAKMREMF